MQLSQAALWAVLVLAPVSDAAGFLGPRHASLVAERRSIEKKDMPVMKHNKTAGDDYNPGSPLFEKQEERKKSGKTGKLETKEAALDPLDGDKALDPAHWEKVMKNESPEKHLENGLSIFLSTFIIVMFVAFVWIKCLPSLIPRSKESYAERDNTTSGFAYGLFSLDHCGGHHGSVCFCAWCCYPLRMADTYSKEPIPIVKNFWTALVIVTCLDALQYLTYGFSGLLLLFFVIYARQQLRKKYGLDRGGATYVTDLFSWICCPCCTIAQEARQVDFVRPAIK